MCPAGPGAVAAGATAPLTLQRNSRLRFNDGYAGRASSVLQSSGSIVIPAEDDCDCLGVALAQHIVDKTVLGRDPA